MSSVSASAHSAPWSVSSANDAPASRPEPTSVLASRPDTDRRSSGSSRLAITNSAICDSRTIAYAHANSSPRSSNARGTASATIRNAAIAAKITSRTAPSSGSTTLVSHE